MQRERKEKCSESTHWMKTANLMTGFPFFLVISDSKSMKKHKEKPGVFFYKCLTFPTQFA